MAAPASPARALHGVIAAVQGGIGTTDKTAYHAWPRVAGHEVPTSDFARFHAEVVELLSEVAEGLRTLDDAQQRRYNAYLPHWWDAVVRPRQDWAATASIIDEMPLDMLASLADVFEARALNAGIPNPNASEMLSKAVSFVLAEVEKDTDLPSTVREQVLADLRHVLWLLEHVSIFGVDHAVTAMEKATGRVVRAASTSGATRLKRAAVGLATALTFVTGVTASVDETVSHVRHVFGITAAASPAHDDVLRRVFCCDGEAHHPPGRW